MTARTAAVQTLTAEVRVLMVGSRQVTMSVYEQLDAIAAAEIEPFGRVSPKAGHTDAFIYVVGRDRQGDLARSYTPRCPLKIDNSGWVKLAAGHMIQYRLWLNGGDDEREFLTETSNEWAELPLIVLAGLR